MRMLIENGDDKLVTAYVNVSDNISICVFTLEEGTEAGESVSVAASAIPDLIQELEAVYTSLRAEREGTA